MQLINAVVSTLLLATATVAQSNNDVTVHVVKVGDNNTLTFSPDNIQAQPGEVVQFQFMSKNHSVVQSAFASPCDPINTVMSNMTGFSSGFMPVKNDVVPVFSLMVNDTKPIWAFCSQVGHCAKGMVFAINAPTTGKTFTEFQAMAMNGTKASSTSSAGSMASGMSTMSSGMSTAMMTGTATGAASTSTSSGSAKTGAGAKPIVNVALLMLFGILGAFFVGL